MALSKVNSLGNRAPECAKRAFSNRATAWSAGAFSNHAAGAFSNHAERAFSNHAAGAFSNHAAGAGLAFTECSLGHRTACANVVLTECAFSNTPAVHLAIRRTRIQQYTGCAFSEYTAGAGLAFAECALGCSADCADVVFTKCALGHAIIKSTVIVQFGIL